MSNRQDTMRARFNERGGLVALYHSAKWNSVAELRCHSPQETLTSLTTARGPKIIATYVHCNERPAEEPQEDGTPAEDNADPCGNAVQKSAPYHQCLRYERSEEMKSWRRLVGDRGGIKFQGKLAKVRDDGCVNTITNVLKDNLILENYERIQRD